MRSHWTPEDEARLRPRCKQVLDAMRDAGWVTMAFVCARTGMRNESTAASRLRDLASSDECENPAHDWRYKRRKTDAPGLYQYLLYWPEQSNNQLGLELEEPEWAVVDFFTKVALVGRSS